MSNKLNLWIIDDDPIYRMVTRTLAQTSDRIGLITEFENIEDAVEAIHNAERMPDLVLLDINIPSSGGWSFLEALQLLNPKYPPMTYVCSSSLNQVDVERANQHPLVRTFISKPLEMGFFSDRAIFGDSFDRPNK